MNRIRKLAMLAIGSVLIALAFSPPVQAAPAHHAKAQTCRSNLQWEIAQPPVAWLYGFTLSPYDVWVSTSSATTWCQMGTGYTLDGFTWFEYQDPGTGNCLTNNSDTSTDETQCQGHASEEWTATNQHGCTNGSCLWAVGNAYTLIEHGTGNPYALNGQGVNNSPNMYPWQGTQDLYENWWAVVV